MKNGYYDLREIILGLRREYRKNAKEINKLKEYVDILDKGTTDIEFYMRHSEGNSEEIRILCSFIEKRNKLQQTIDTLSKRAGFYIYGREMGKVKKSDEGIYQICGHHKTRISDNESFAAQIEIIKNSEFVKKIPSFYLTYENNKIENTLNLDISTIESLQKKNDENKTEMIYDARNDKLLYTDFLHMGQKGSKEDSTLLLDTLYETKFPKVIFTEYQQRLIEEGNLVTQDIEVDRRNIRNNSGIYIFDDNQEGTIVLRKVNRKSQ